MIILIDTDNKILEVDHDRTTLDTYNELATVLMHFGSYNHISLVNNKTKPKKKKLPIDKDVKPTENNIKK